MHDKNTLSSKIKRYFYFGGPKKEVTNFDMIFSIIIVIVILAIGIILFL